MANQPPKSPSASTNSAPLVGYRVKFGMNYGPSGTRVEAGDSVGSLPPESLGWLIEQGAVISLADEQAAADAVLAAEAEEAAAAQADLDARVAAIQKALDDQAVTDAELAAAHAAEQERLNASVAEQLAREQAVTDAQAAAELALTQERAAAIAADQAAADQAPADQAATTPPTTPEA